jgi:hypothetical protein
MLINRASTWAREHFCRSTIAPGAAADLSLGDLAADTGKGRDKAKSRPANLVFACPSR